MHLSMVFIVETVFTVYYTMQTFKFMEKDDVILVTDQHKYLVINGTKVSNTKLESGNMVSLLCKDVLPSSPLPGNWTLRCSTKVSTKIWISTTTVTSTNQPACLHGYLHLYVILQLASFISISTYIMFSAYFRGIYMFI